MRTSCLSLKQPWAHLIIHGLPDRTGAIHRKNVENRSWRPVLTIALPLRLVIHASAKQDPREYWAAVNLCQQEGLDCRGLLVNEQPAPPVGGIIGMVEVWRIDPPGDDDLDSAWRVRGQYGWRVRNPRPLPFYACRGSLGLWPPTREILALLELPVLTPAGPAPVYLEENNQLPGWAANV